MKVSQPTSRTPKLNHTHAHYLMAIHTISEEQGYVRSVDLAKHCKKTKGAVSMAIKTLTQKNLVIKDPNKHLKLTERGKRITTQYLGAKMALYHFFTKVLKVPPHVASKDACSIEHHLSPQTVDELVRFCKLS